MTTAGWVAVGGSDLTMGALSGSTATAARFFAPGIALAAEGTVEFQITIPRAGIVRNLRLNCAAGTGGGSNTYTLRKNGSNTSLSFAVSNTATSGSNTSTSVVVAAGDLISIQVTKSVAPATPQTNISLTFELTG